MNAPLDIKLTKAEFFRWVQGREGHFELSGGRIMQQMTGGTVRHFDLAEAIADLIKSKIDRTIWRITVGGPGVAVPTSAAGVTTRYPDVVVRPHGGAPTSLEINNPAVLVEVLSPSSMTVDLVIKPREYLSIPSLEAYIVANQDEPRLTVWARGADRAFPALPVEYADPKDDIRIEALTFAATLAEFYSGMTPA